jgi:hypothetical protein
LDAVMLLHTKTIVTIISFMYLTFFLKRNYIWNFYIYNVVCNNILIFIFSKFEINLMNNNTQKHFESSSNQCFLKKNISYNFIKRTCYDTFVKN